MRIHWFALSAAIASSAQLHAEEVSGRGVGSDIIVTGERAVTATKSDTPIVETPQSISVVSREQMDRQGATDSLTQILSYVPGILASPYGYDSRVDRFVIRGFDASGAGLYRDSLQLPSFGDSDRSFRVEPYGVERLEIVRGPSSVLYGNGSLGGLVNAISKRPTQTPLHEIEVEAGTHSRFAGKFDFGGPIDDEGVLSYRLTGLARDSDTQVDFAHNDRLFIAPAFTWKPNDNTSLTVLGHFQKSITAGNAQGFPAIGTLFASPNGKIPVNRTAAEPKADRQESIQYSAGYILEHRFDPGLVFRQNARFDHVDVDALTVYAAGPDPDDATGRRVARAVFTGLENVDAIAIDNQLQANFTTGPIAHTLIAGFEYKHIDFDDAQGGGGAPSLDIFTPTYGAVITRPDLYMDSNTKQTQVGLYVQERMKFRDRLVISLGGRQDFVWKTRSDRLAVTRAHSKDKAFSGSAGLLYLADNGLAPYVSYTESFLPVFGADVNGRAFEPETGRQFEGGVKFQPKGQKSYISVAAFDLKRRNVLTADPATNGNTSIQTGEQKSRGIEVEAVASLLDASLNVSAAYTYQHVEVTKSNFGDQGNRPAIVPANIASLYADYLVPDGPLAGFGFGAGVRYQSSTFGDADNSFKVAGFTLFDAGARYTWKNLRFAINAQNLFDKHYVSDCYSLDGCSFGSARTIVGTVRYGF